MASSPTQKYGKAEVITKIGGKALSSQLPRIHPLSRPINVPRRKAMTVVTPTRPRVQGRAWKTMVLTDVPKLVVIEMPKLKVTTRFQ